MARERRTRVNGPYAHRGRWRVFLVYAGGKRVVKSYATKEEAAQVIRSLTRELGGEATIQDAIAGYLKWLTNTGVRPVTVTNCTRSIDRFFGGRVGRPLRTFGLTQAQEVYDELTERYAVATHRQTLVDVKRWGGWCVKAKLLRSNPIAGVEPVGRAKVGKPKLRQDEARKLLEACLVAFGNGDQYALMPLLCLGLGIRAGEVVKLQARDVDDSGRLLWVEEAKTDAGKRVLEVADALAVCLYHQAKDRVGQLIPDANTGKVRHHVRRMCRAAGVPEVCPHGLRGTHATLAAGRGATSALLMAALGHTSIEMTKRHYLAPGTMDRAQANAAWVSLRPAPVTRAPIDVVPEKKDE